MVVLVVGSVVAASAAMILFVLVCCRTVRMGTWTVYAPPNHAGNFWVHRACTVSVCAAASYRTGPKVVRLALPNTLSSRMRVPILEVMLLLLLVLLVLLGRSIVVFLLSVVAVVPFLCLACASSSWFQAKV